MRLIQVQPQEVLAMLRRPARTQALVGLGEIVDPSHSCMREHVASARDEASRHCSGEADEASSSSSSSSSSSHSSSSGVYLAYAKVALAKGCVLGEYTGKVNLDSLVIGEENSRYASNLLQLPMAYNYVYTETQTWDARQDGQIVSETLTVDAYSSGNELRFINDYRDNLEHFEDSAKQAQQANVQAFEVTWQGAPHIMLATTRMSFARILPSHQPGQLVSMMYVA
jgi:hypothetical protein